MTDGTNVRIKTKKIHNSRVLPTRHHASGIAESVKSCGPQQPFIVRSIKDRPYEIEIIEGARYRVLTVKR